MRASGRSGAAERLPPPPPFPAAAQGGAWVALEAGRGFGGLGEPVAQVAGEIAGPPAAVGWAGHRVMSPVLWIDKRSA